MKKFLILFLIFLTACSAFAAKYTVNSSGTVRKNGGNVITSPANTTNQNYYNNYYANQYVASNIVNENQTGIIEIVMDYSGSMANWIEVAKRSMASIISQIPTSTLMGFRVFGHDNYGKNPQKTTVLGVNKVVKKGKKMVVVTEKNVLGQTSGVCSATEQVSGIMSANAYNLIRGMNSVHSGGATPLVYALDRAVYQDFAKFDDTTPKKIVLITDGGENCGGDPCAFAKQLMSKRSDVHIDVVLVSSSSRSLSCLASTTGGNLYRVDDLSEFSNTVTNSINSEPKNVSPADPKPEQNYEFIQY